VSKYLYNDLGMGMNTDKFIFYYIFEDMDMHNDMHEDKHNYICLDSDVNQYMYVCLCMNMNMN
jgi:hypothetical protein